MFSAQFCRIANVLAHVLSFSCKRMLQNICVFCFVQAVAKSTLPFVQYEVARIADRKDPFARRIFLTSLCDNRTRMHLQEFGHSRAYFFERLSEQDVMMTEASECIPAC